MASKKSKYSYDYKSEIDTNNILKYGFMEVQIFLRLNRSETWTPT